ncbi:MAG TPA: protein-tyrosine kinase [Clostridiales bacterium]|nr:protein-tyrosine kinase [Clostridiales bacterium]
MIYSYKDDDSLIDVRGLFYLLYKRIWIIGMASIGFALMAFLFSRFVMEPTYQSTTRVYVQNKEENDVVTYSDLQTGSQLTKDFIQLVKSRPVIEQVILELDLDVKYGTLANMVTVVNPSDTRLLDITVEYKDPYLAKQIADAIREVASVHIMKVMDIGKINKAEDAYIPEFPSSPNILLNTILGGFIGGFLSILIILVLYMLDDTMKTPDDVERYLGLSVLSSIPMHNRVKEKKKKKVKSNKSNPSIKKEKKKDKRRKVA